MFFASRDYATVPWRGNLVTEACVDDQYSTRNKDSVCLLEELLHLTHVSIGTRQVVENLQCVVL